MLLTPEIIFRHVESITPEFLRSRGIRALVLDVDNTLTGDGSQQLDESVQAWLDTMRAAGVSLTIVSNNTAKRVRPPAGGAVRGPAPAESTPQRHGHGGGPDLHRPDGGGVVRHPVPVCAAPHPPRQEQGGPPQAQAGSPLCAQLL